MSALPEVPTYNPAERADLSDRISVPRHLVDGARDRSLASTFDQSYIKANPYDAAVDRFQPYNSSPLRMVQGFMRDRGIDPAGSIRNMGQNPYTAAIAPSLVGAGLGAALKYFSNRRTGDSGGYVLPSLLGAGAAGLLGYGVNKYMNQPKFVQPNGVRKFAFFSDPAEEFIRRTVMQSTDIAFSEKQMVANALPSMSSRDKEDLRQKLLTYSGAGLGMVIVKFMGSKGLLPLAIGGILGGLAGNQLSSFTQTNSLGQYIY